MHPKTVVLTTVDEPDLTMASVGLVLGLTFVHLLVSRVEVPGAKRARVLSAAGGASIAYVFVLIFPEINEAVLVVVESPGQLGVIFRREMGVYAVVLFGFVCYYGVHVYVTHRGGEHPEESNQVFLVSLVSFGVYNALIGYLLFHQEVPGLQNLLFYSLAMALHFAVNDEALRRHHGLAYDRIGRWVLATAVLAGGTLGATTTVRGDLLAVLFAFLAGGIVFNVIKEELPEPQLSRFGWFVAGAFGYTTILLLR